MLTHVIHVKALEGGYAKYVMERERSLSKNQVPAGFERFLEMLNSIFMVKLITEE
jgi:hypothetical protein